MQEGRNTGHGLAGVGVPVGVVSRVPCLAMWGLETGWEEAVVVPVLVLCLWLLTSCIMVWVWMWGPQPVWYDGSVHP